MTHDEAAGCLRAMGFEVVTAETMSLAEQVKMFYDAELIVGLHGAGLTNALFAPRAAVLEIIGDYGDGILYSISAAFKRPHMVLPCRPEGSDVYVDTGALMRCIDKLKSIS